MCGINGFIKANIKEDNAKTLLDNMNISIKHRGPDDSGIFVEEIGDNILGFGQVRLSIIDLSPAGHQPMYYSKGFGANSECFNPQSNNDLAIVFNGEIYNYIEIKEELIIKGYKFSTKSDTEVIFASYLERGNDCVNKFNGFWAFCIYDKANNKLFCSRDRLGKKPLYYYFDGTNFIFSSEIKGILEHKELNINNKDNINLDAIDFYFTTGFIPAPITIYKNVNKLEASNNLELKIENGKLKISNYRYYNLPAPNVINDRNLLIEHGKKLLEDSVKIRMFRSDVPVGAFLSGGLDSSSVVSEMTKYTEKSKLHTFSIGFEGKYDETPYINIVKDAFGTNHHHKYFRKEDFEELIDNIYYYYDEPFADYSNFPTTFVSQLARENVTVTLSGDGGDEIFGGYFMHVIAAQMSFLYRLPFFIKKIFYTLTPSTSDNLSILSKLKEAFRVSMLPKEEFYANVGGSTIYKPEIYKRWSIDKMKEILDTNNGNFIQSMIDYDLMYATLGDNFLTKVDKASMSQALEVRSPFLDYRWIEFSRKIPVRWKVTWNKTKILMRDIIKDIVPEAIIKRGKKGFEPPIKDWILEEQYMVQIINGLEKLHKINIIDVNWYRFYKESVFVENNTVFNVYKVKLFLLIKWVEKWI